MSFSEYMNFTTRGRNCKGFRDFGATFFEEIEFYKLTNFEDYPRSLSQDTTFDLRTYNLPPGLSSTLFNLV